VAQNKETNVEALFVNLKKSEEDFSPTTMYDDYAINETLFHWQSQNKTSSEIPKGLSYINQENRVSRFCFLYVKLKGQLTDLLRAMYFIGPAKYVEHTGSTHVYKMGAK